MMLLNKKFLTTLFVIFCDFNKVWSKGHSHGHGSRRSSSSNHNSDSTSGHNHYTKNSAASSNAHKETWSSYYSDELKTSDTTKPIISSPPDNDSFKYSLPFNSFNEYKYKPVTYEQGLTDDYIPTSLPINKLENFITGFVTGKDLSNKSPSDNDNFYRNYRYSNAYHPPIVIPPSIANRQSENQLKTFSNNFDSLNLNIPPMGISNSLTVHCQKQLHSEFNERGEIVDSIKQICNPLTPTSTTTQRTISTGVTTTRTVETSSTPAFKTYAGKEKRYERILASTPRGINCRKVMNSEFNERGEIVDSVTEVCDPPTTTTTTTKKPILRTTTRRPLTTPKPLIKICRRVMDSYLNEAGEIIDSVTEVCTMEPVKN